MWHQISAQDLLKKSPLLASPIGIATSKGLNAVCHAVLRAINRDRKTDKLHEPNEPGSLNESIREYWFKLTWHELHRKLHDKPESYIGCEVDQYSLREFVGMGGTGAVFKAVHIPFGKPVALKLFYALKGDWDSITRATERAVRGLASVRHPGVVSLVDFGYVSTKQGGTAYLAYEFVDGKPLNRWSSSISGARDSLARRLDIACKIVESLKISHNCSFVGDLGFQEKGVLHGDIKPSNILVRTNDEQPVIFDFMIPDIQRLIENPHFLGSYWRKRGDGSYWYDLPMTGIFGTPGFMPTEQELDGVVSPTSDVYSLGMTFSRLFWPTAEDDFGLFEVMSEAKKGHSGKTEQEIANLIDEMTAAQPSERIQNMSIVQERLQKIK